MKGLRVPRAFPFKNTGGSLGGQTDLRLDLTCLTCFIWQYSRGILHFSPPARVRAGTDAGTGTVSLARGQDSRGLFAGTGRHAGIARAHAGWALKAPIG